MRQAHHPFWYEKLAERFNRRCAEHFVHPHFDSLGVEPRFAGCQYIDVRGPNIRAGDHLHIYATRQEPLSLAVDPFSAAAAASGSASSASWRPACGSARPDRSDRRQLMFAEDTLVTDADWHDHYHRIYPGKRSRSCSRTTSGWARRHHLQGRDHRREQHHRRGLDRDARHSEEHDRRRQPRTVLIGEIDPHKPTTRREALFIYHTPYQKLKDDFDRSA